jgi:hypothetical protein
MNMIHALFRSRLASSAAHWAVAPGWPRRHASCAADYDHYGDVLTGRPMTRPMPWAAAVAKLASGMYAWDPGEFDARRAHRMRTQDRCQVCASRRGDEVFVLAPHPRIDDLVEMWGGALCSMRCAMLTAAMCPHYYRTGGPIAVYAVPRHTRVDLNGFGEANDDEYDLSHDLPVRVVRTAGGRRAIAARRSSG